MSRGNWRFILAALGFLAAAAALWFALRPERPVQRGQYVEASYREYRPGGPACDPQRLNRLKSGEATNERQRCEEAAEEHRLKSDDLVQQTRSADAADALVSLTYSQSRMMLAGAIIGLLTLIAAGYAAWFAKRAAEAAEKGLGHAEGVSEAQLRAYLYPGIFKIEHLLGSSWRATVPLINGGNTPATDVKTHFVARLVPMPLKTADIWECRLSGIMYSAMGPKADRQLNAPIAISPEIEARIYKHELAVLAQFTVGYTTYTGKEVTEPASMAMCTGHDLTEKRMRIVTPKALQTIALRESQASGDKG